MTDSQRSGSESQTRDGMTEKKIREIPCLRCERIFRSSHIFNRLCERCNRDAEQMPVEHDIRK